MKAFVRMILLLLLSFLICSCKQETPPKNEAETQSSPSDYIYTYQIVSLPDTDPEQNTISYYGNETAYTKPYILDNYYTALGGNRLFLFYFPNQYRSREPMYVSLDTETKEISYARMDSRIDDSGNFAVEEDESYLISYEDENGNPQTSYRYCYDEIYNYASNASGDYAVMYQYYERALKKDYDPTDIKEIILADGTVSYMRPNPFETMRKYMLAVYHSDGTLRYETSLSDIPSCASLFANDSLSKCPVLLSDEGYACVMIQSSLLLFDADGAFLAAVEADTKPSYDLYTSLQKASDGTCYLKYLKADVYTPAYCVIDFETQSLSEPTELTGIEPFDSVFFGENGTVYYSDQLNFYRYHTDGTTEIIFSWASMNIIGADIDTVYIRDEHTFIVVTRDPMKEKPEIVYIDYVPADSVAPKTEIVLACGDYRNDSSLRALQTAVSLFNRSSQDYRVTIASYDPDNQDAFSLNQQIANDMMNGKQIDLIFFHGDITMEYFESFGILGDWYGCMDADAVYQRSAFLPCVLSAYETSDGRLPVLTTDFGLTTLVGASENLGGMKAWDYSACSDFIGTLDWDQILLQLDRDKDNTDSDAMLVLKSFLPMVLEDYLDMDSGSCSFDTESFREFLTLCSEIPINHEQAAYKHADGVLELIYESAGFLNEYRGGKTILFNQEDNALNGAYTICHPSDVMNILDNFFITYDDVTFIGYPMPDASVGNGTAVTPWVQIGLTAHAEHKDGAWKFVKAYLDYQKDREQTIENVPYLPCTRAALDALLDAYETYTYLSNDMPFLQEFTDYSSDLDNPFYLAANMEVRGILLALTETTTRRYSGRTALMNIIYEEAPYFFDGIQSLEDVTKRIQSRAGIYLSEQQ